MDQRQPVVQQLASCVPSIALMASAAGLVRMLFQLLSPDPQYGSVSASKSTSSTESEGIVSNVNRGNAKGILVAAVVGAAIGAGVALLVAPQSGKESREWLARRTRGLKDRIGVAFDPSPDVIPNGVLPS